MKNAKNAQVKGSNNRLFKEFRDESLGPIDTKAVVEEVPSECPNCHSKNVRKKEKRLYHKNILHVENGSLKRIIMMRPRCECRDCKASFLPNSFTLFNNSMFTEEAADNITKAILENPWISPNKVAANIAKETGMGSSSAVDRLIKKRIEDFSSAIRTIPCYKIFYIPFKYRKIPNCYAIVGLNTTEKKLFLLDILKSDSEDELKRFYCKTDYFKERVRLSLADLNRPLLDSVNNYYPCSVGVLTGLLTNYIDTFQDKEFSLINQKNKALKELKEKVTHIYKEKYYYDSFKDWEEKYLLPNPTLEEELRPMLDEILSFKRECWIGTSHKSWEPEFTSVLSAISILEKNNVPFDFMVLRLLYANRAATNTLAGTQVSHYIQKITKPISVPIENFGVDIDKLYWEIRAEFDYLDYWC